MPPSWSTMGDAAQFAIDLDETMGDIEEDILHLTQRVAMYAHEGVVTKTPVDTGAARASWVVSVGAPSDAVPPPGSPPSVVSVAAMKRPDLVYIQSNIDYIEALENGHSSQAPRGMVAVTIAEIEAGFADR